MMMKKVIFVGGTAYSGSTFFDMTLANDPAGFSCGEVYAMFNPFRSHHVDPLCGCGDVNCEIWPQVLAAGEEHCYETIFALHPEVNFIVDSSKDPIWIARQIARLQEQAIDARHILIWKTPLELAASFKKRGELDNWERSWVNYHRLYHTLVSGWRSVPYADYTQDASVLEEVCNFLGIPFFAGKASYWEKTHHLLFGNDSARVHLVNEVTRGQSAPSPMGSGEPQRQTIYYSSVEDAELERLVSTTISESPYISALVSLLTERDIRNQEMHTSDTAVELKLGVSNVQLRRLKQNISYGVSRLRYR